MPKQPISKKIRLPRSGLIPVGVSGEPTISSFSNEETRVDDLTITDYRRMIDNDGQLQMLWNAICNSILSVGITIDDDDEWENEDPSPEKTFVTMNLFSPRYRGGMSKSLELTNRTMLRAFIEAFRVFEVIYRVGDDGLVYLDKLAPRAGKTDSELRLLVDDDGDFNGFKQTTTFKGRRVDITVVNESEIPKVVKSTFGEEFGSNYGRSGLKSAWYHYDKAHKGMHLNHVGHELGTVRAKWLKPKIGDEDRITDAINVMTRLHMESTIAIPEDDFGIEMLELSDPAVMNAGLEMIRFHYSAMAKSVLAQFIDLGSSISSTGSRSLGDVHVDFFKQNLQSVAEILIENTWNPVIAGLCRVNFGNEIYPRLRVNEIDTKMAQRLLDSFMELIKKDKVTKTIQAKILGNVSEKLGLDVSEEDIVTEMDEEKKERNEKAKQIQAQIAGQQPQLPQEKKGDKRPAVEMDDPIMDLFPVTPSDIRTLYPDEQKVKVVDIRRVWEEKRLEMERTFSTKLRKQKEGILKAYIEASRLGLKSIPDVDIELDENEMLYSEEVLRQAIDMLEFGKVMSANEIDKAVPNTPMKIRKGVETEVSLSINKQISDLKYRLQLVAMDGLQKGLPENTILLMLEKEYDSYWDSVFQPMIGMLQGKMFNRGREITFEKYDDDIFAYRYTAILDDRTTAFCKELDGSVVQFNDPDFPMFTPPNHYGCRSFWTPILKSESEGVEVTGVPMDLPKFTTVNTFRDVNTSDLEQRIEKLIDSLSE